MCGFAGEVAFGGRADLALAERMAGRLAHRGPDEAGSFLSSDGRCAIGFRRLAIIDPPLSHQPISIGQPAVTLAFNGEIYNFKSLRQELVAQGTTLTTHGDTEVLLQMYLEHGVAALSQLAGMFAFAVYDGRSGQLLLARDRLGQKPLWYARLPNRIVFASEAKALLAHPSIDKAISNSDLLRFLSFGYIPAPGSIWAAIRKLQPGHSLFIGRSGEGEPAPYWRPTCPQTAPDSQSLLPVRDALVQSVREHLIADVPVGVLLSGGIDSSAVATLAVEASGDAGSVRTFTAGFADDQYDERSTARRTARHLGTTHTELTVEPPAAGFVDDLVAMYDEPFGDSSALPTWLVCQAARQHVKVALTGDGGDEVFAGYDRYRAMHMADTMSPPKYLAVRLAAGLAKLWAPAGERNRWRRLIRFADAMTLPAPVQYLRYRSIFQPDDLGRLLTDNFTAGLDLDDPARWFCDLYEAGDCADEAMYAQRHDLLTYLPDDVLVKTDIASMAVSLELRAPMLDHRVVERALALPLSQRLDGRHGKLALRQMLADKLPAEVFSQPKRGFGVPLARWLRTTLRPQMQETLLDRQVAAMGIFRPEALHGLINDHLSGRDDHSHRLWSLMVLTRWLVANR